MPSRVAVVGPTHPYKGGIAQHTTQLVLRMAAAGYDVELVSWSAQYPRWLYPGEQRVADQQRPEAPVFPRTSYPLAWWRPDSWWRTGRRLRRAADVVVIVLVSPAQAPAYLVLLRALGRRARVVALCHNVLPHEPRSIDVPLTRSVLRRVDGVLVHTPAEELRARGLIARPGAVVAVAPMAPSFQGSPLAASDPSLSSGNSTGDSTGDTEAAPQGPVRRRVLFFGLVRPYKGLDVLLEALALVPEVRLTVAGEFWTSAEAFARRVDALGLTDRVDMQPGYVAASDVPRLFAGYDALVLPYRAATASQQVELAFAHGLPVVATTVGSLATAVHDGIDGLAVPPNDVPALAAALCTLYQPGVLAKLRAGVEPVDAAPLWDAYLETLVQLADPPDATARS